MDNNIKDKVRQRIRESTVLPVNGKAPAPSKGHGQAEASSDNGVPWDMPIPFPTDLVLPAFPVDCLPSWLAAWVTAEASATQTPPDLAAMLTLAAAGAALA